MSQTRYITKIYFFFFSVLMLVAGLYSAPLFAQTSAPQYCTLNISEGLELLFGTPAILNMSQAFGLGFVPPMTTYLAGYVVGVIVNFWNK